MQVDLNCREAQKMYNNSINSINVEDKLKKKQNSILPKFMTEKCAEEDCCEILRDVCNYYSKTVNVGSSDVKIQCVEEKTRKPRDDK